MPAKLVWATIKNTPANLQFHTYKETKMSEQEKTTEKISPSKESAAGRAKSNREAKEAQIRQIFDDNKSGRPQHPDKGE
jgi:hypothetical protein